MIRVYYKSDYKIRETFKTQGGETIDPRAYNFTFVFRAGRENTFTCSHTIGGGENEWVNCVYDSVNNAVLCTLDNHNLLPGRLKRELTIEEPDSDFPDGKLDYITYKAYDIELVETPDGDSLYDIYDEEIVVINGVNPVELAEILHESEIKDEISDDDEFSYLDSENGFGIVKTTWLNIKAKLKAYFDTIYASITHNHNLNDLAEKSYYSLTDIPSLDFEPANENIQSHIGDEDIHVTSLQKEDFHAHTNKTALDAVKGVNTGDQSSSDFDIKDLSDTTSLRSIWSDKQDALTFSTNIETDKESTTKISAIKTFYDWAVAKFLLATKLVTLWSGTPSDENIPSEKLVYDELVNLDANKYDKNATDLLLGAKEDITNKSSNVDTDKTSTTKYANVKAIYDWAVGKFIDSAKKVISWAATPSNDNIPSEKLVKDSLNLKADIAPANGSTSALRALFTSVPDANCVYNTATGYYEMNGLTDLTEAQLRAAYSIVFNGIDFRVLMRFVSIRTNFPVQVISYDDMKLNLSYFCLGSNIEVFAFRVSPSFGNKVYVSSLSNSFRFCDKLKKIIGVLDVSAVNSFNGSFVFIPAFEQIELLGLKANIAFAQSPLLNFYTLQYMVTNRANGTTRITITVHPTVWSKLNDAENYPEWNALLGEAFNNYIDFASA